MKLCAIKATYTYLISLAYNNIIVQLNYLLTSIDLGEQTEFVRQGWARFVAGMKPDPSDN